MLLEEVTKSMEAHKALKQRKNSGWLLVFKLANNK